MHENQHPRKLPKKGYAFFFHEFFVLLYFTLTISGHMGNKNKGCLTIYFSSLLFFLLDIFVLEN